VRKKRRKHFDQAVAKPLVVNDSRFGLRQLPNSKEDPSIFSYSSPGKGPNGEHQT
jgi:hypothetical protein